uniref:SWIM-type domain-containing protein n=2 Tax=Cajanus cajan TaxID=3821 RepID=A0A151QYU4_CAJCA|nr:hypothetical protein KK1_043531 [Cajanus cajan]
MQESSTFSLENLSIERSPLITRDEDEDDEDDEDYHVSSSYESIDESNEDEIDNCEPSDDEVQPNVVVNSPMVQPISMYPSTEGGSQFWGNLPHYTNINWNHPDEEDIPGMDVGSTWSIGQDLYVGLEFENKDAVKNAVKQNAMRMHQSFYVVESKKTKWVVKCPNAHDGCGWYMRAIESKRSDKWKVTQWGGRHTCLNMSLSQDHAKLDSELIATFIQGMVNQDPSIKISLIQERITSQTGFKISYRKAWMAKQKAIVNVFGDWEESYAYLPRWLQYMKEIAPGSFYDLCHDEFFVGNRCHRGYRQFHRLFWTFKPCCDAFNFCKPLIQVDGTHLYGKYRGTLLIATTQDGNNNVLPLAFAVVEGETLLAWSWFLSHLRLHVTNKEGICLISDRHRSIKSAIENEAIGWRPPNAYHKYCIRHIASNFNTRFKDVKLKQKLVKLGYTPCKHIFDRNLQKFCESSPDVERWIGAISKDKWSMAYDADGRRYGHMTTNLSECVNKVLKDCRNLPITALVRSTYTRCAEYFSNRGSRALADVSSGKVFVSKLVEALQKNQEEACSHQVCRYDIQSSKFEVEEAFDPVTQTGGKKWVVNLQQRYCQCGKFTAFHYPCSHVIAACGVVSIDYYQFIDHVYTCDYVLKAYSGPWEPIGNEDLIPPSNEDWILVPDPSSVRGKGRPKSTRIRNEMDWVESSQRRPKCSICK